MGAHLYFKVEDESNARLANRIVEETNGHAKLETLGEYCQRVHFFEEDIYPGEGGGSIKTNCIQGEYKEEAMEAYVSIFEALHEHEDIEVKILTKSCSLRIYTFTFDQLLRLTNDGEALSGDKKDLYREILENRKSIGNFPSEFAEQLQEESPQSAIETDQTDITQISDLLTNKNHIKALDVYLTYHDMYVSQSVLVRETDLNLQEANDALEAIDNHGLLKHSSIDTSHELYVPLKSLHWELTAQTEEPKVAA